MRTERRVIATDDAPLALACGRELGHVEVAYETYGELNAAADNAVVVLHALTADAHAAGVSAETGRPGWWDALIGPARAIDTGRWFVVCGNLLGSCCGTTGPTSPNPVTGAPWGIDFPPLTIADQVAALRRLGAALGITRYHALVGPSMGGMHALEWFLQAPEEIASTALIATSSELTVENRAFSAAGRLAITSDPGFDGGRYLERGGAGPVHGLAAARRFAHITYVSADGLDRKLGDAVPAGPPPADAAAWLAPSRAVERYLEHQGEAFLRRFDALSYLYLTRPMDDFAPFASAAGRRRAAAAIDRNPAARHRVLSFDSDWRFGSDHSERLVGQLQSAGAEDVAHRVLSAPWGHDSFLLDAPGLPEWLAEALAD